MTIVPGAGAAEADAAPLGLALGDALPGAGVAAAALAGALDAAADGWPDAPPPPQAARSGMTAHHSRARRRERSMSASLRTFGACSPTGSTRCSAAAVAPDHE